MRWPIMTLLLGSMQCQGCEFNLEAYLQVSADYVCDLTVPLLQHDKKMGKWALAAPQKGTGCHEYAAFSGAPPSRCKVGMRCSLCENPMGAHIKSVYFEYSSSGTCGMCGPRRRFSTKSGKHEL